MSQLSAIVYDIEIIKGIPAKGEERIEGIEYCAGWHDHANMGVSVIGVYDFVEDRYRVFCSDNAVDFLALVDDRDLRISFNGIGFDDKVINHCINKGVPAVNHYDLLQEIYSAYGRRFAGSGLNSMCEANGLGGKTGNGALAPVMWQRGQVGAVIDYCLSDVKLTKELFLLSQAGPIKCPKGGTLNLRRIS